MHRDRKQTGDHQGLWGFQGRWRELGGGGARLWHTEFLFQVQNKFYN